MRTLSIIIAVTASLAACRASAAAARPTSGRERDSVVGASRLPGAQGVRGALRISDSAAARRAREDSAVEE